MISEADPLYTDPELAGFYDLDNGERPDLDFCARLAAEARSVLDLGCGTGALAARLARGTAVTGVDPAAAMLEIARARTPGAEWIEADARAVRLGRRFKLVVMLGHAFQTMLSDDDQQALLATVAAHLAPAGRFVFDMRNPAREEWREWTPAASTRRLHHPRHGAVTAWNEVDHEPATGTASEPATGLVRYRTAYRFERTGRAVSADSLIRFSDQPHVAALLARAGLAADRWLGDWDGRPFAPDAPEIIPLGRLAEGVPP